jgi:NAD+ synthase
MPNGNHSSPESVDHAELLINLITQMSRLKHKPYLTINIGPIVDSITSLLGNCIVPESGKRELTSLRSGNVAARVRMITLFDYAATNKCLVLGTENKSEHYLGYFTLFGDNASCIEPIRELLKTEVYDLARYLGIPKEIINKAPSADLWEGQTDEGELGFTYAAADRVIGLLEQGIGSDDEQYKKIIAHINHVAFKNKLPYVVPVKCAKK